MPLAPNPPYPTPLPISTPLQSPHPTSPHICLLTPYHFHSPTLPPNPTPLPLYRHPLPTTPIPPPPTSPHLPTSTALPTLIRLQQLGAPPHIEWLGVFATTSMF
ncbi:hypothetical protein Pmani_025520 [Petrolisthes manimaculis]|uniref:Uncharacterized protein n=1 Tax=Petrolisthes manimaculis TaxID=1843537 RepID=A0AAE1P6L0_9EUCA|nr:hypothetical protein Pmani_025520 [Petrolisthes manimaculis]